MTLQIPISIKLHNRREMSDYEQIAIQDLTAKAAAFFDLIEYFSDELGSGGYDGITFSSFFLVSSQIGRGLLEAAEITANDFKRYAAKSEVKNEQNQN